MPKSFSARVGARQLPKTWERQREPRALPSRSARAVRARGPGCARPGTLALRAPEGGDWVPLVCRGAAFQLPRLGEERAHGARKLHLKSFTLSRAGAGWEETRPPRGQARRAGGRKGGSPFPLGVVPVSTSSVLAPADEADGRHARQTNTCWGGQEAELPGPVGGPCLPPGRARRFAAESPADQRAGGKGRGARRRRGVGRSRDRAAGDPGPSPSAL